MSCPICTNSYYDREQEQEECAREQCEYICDTGKQCKLIQINEGLCSTHQVQRLSVTCLSCQKDCCKVCYRTFFLQSLEEPKCVHCDKGFDLEFLLGYDENKTQRFTKSFVWGPWKEHREDVLLDQIMTRMPHFQTIAEAEIRAENTKEKIIKIKERIRDIKSSHFNTLKLISVYEEFNKDTTSLTAKVQNNKERIIKLEEFLKQNDGRVRPQAQVQAQNGQVDGDIPALPEEEKDGPKTHGKCHVDECNGYITSKWECGICSTKVCSKCHSIKKKNHTCNPDEVESIKVMKSLGKPCPSCNQMIERTYGCNQMWCTQCHTFFDYASGKAIKNTQYAHNPEHVAWALKNGQLLGNNFVGNAGPNAICGLNIEQITRANIPENQKEILAEFFRFSNEIRGELQGYQNPIDRLIQKHAIDFLKSKITREELKKMIQRNYKASKKAELANMRRTMYADTVQQIIGFAIGTNADIEKTVLALNNLRDYTESALVVIGNIFNSEKPHLSNMNVRDTRYNLNVLPGQITKYINNYIVDLKDPKLSNREKYFNYERREIMCYLSNTKNEHTFAKFIKENPDWMPTKDEIAEAIKETTKALYKQLYKFRDYINSTDALGIGLQICKRLNLFESRCMNLNITYRDQIDDTVFPNRCINTTKDDSCFCTKCDRYLVEEFKTLTRTKLRNS